MAEMSEHSTKQPPMSLEEIAAQAAGIIGMIEEFSLANPQQPRYRKMVLTNLMPKQTDEQKLVLELVNQKLNSTAGSR